MFAPKVKNCSTVYYLLHQELKACANHLLELSDRQDFFETEDKENVVSRFHELLQFAQKIRTDEYPHPLIDLKYHLESNVLLLSDIDGKMMSMRLSEAILLLKQGDAQTKIFKTLSSHFIKLFFDECRPNRPLFQRLKEIEAL